MKPGFTKQRQVNLLILLFGLGIIGGWLLRDQFSLTAAEGNLLPVDGANALQTDMDSLIRNLNEGRFDQAIRIADLIINNDHDRSTEVNSLIDTTAGGLIRQQQFLQAGNLLESYYEHFNPSMQSLILLARSFAGTKEHRQQVSTLFQAKMLADTPAEEEQISLLLKKAINLFSEFLVAKNLWGELDLFHQELISAEPENPDHYLQLALLRIRVGDRDGALDPLVRIENDPVLGEQVRQLMAKVQRKSELAPFAGVEIPLLVHGSQFIVKARVDNHRDLNLLIDTGAAITIIESHLLLELGYNLNGETQYFNTANGTIQAPMVDVQDLSLGSISVKELPVAAVDLGMSRNIDGLLGMNFLRHYQFRIDQTSNVLYLNPIVH